MQGDLNLHGGHTSEGMFSDIVALVVFDVDYE